VDIICNKRRIPNDSTFALFEIMTDNGVYLTERFLEGHSRVLDILAGWFIVRDQYMHKYPKSDLKFKLVFKVKLFNIEYLQSNMLTVPDDVLEMFFIQGVSDVVQNRLPTTFPQAFELAALQVQGTFGDADCVSLVRNHVADYLPRIAAECVRKERKLQNAKKKQKKEENKPNAMTYISVCCLASFVVNFQKEFDVPSRMLTDRDKFRGIEKRVAQQHYLNFLLSTWEIYGTMQWAAEQMKPTPGKGQEAVIIAVNERGFFVLDPETKYIQMLVKYSNMITVAVDGSTFQLIAGSQLHNKPLEFRTKQGSQIMQLMEAYKEF